MREGGNQVSTRPEQKVFDRCKRIDDLSHVVPGWGCCHCSAYNNYARAVCKNCGHVPCYPPKEVTK